MINSKLDENVFDALFGQAVIDNFNEQFDLITNDTDIEPQFSFSNEHEKRMKILLTKENRKEKIRKTIKWSKRVAAIFIIAISLLFGSLMLVSEVRAVVIGTVVEWFDQFTRFSSTAPEAEKTNLEPTYIPDGFREDIRQSEKNITVILYINDNDGVDIYFESSIITAQLSVDNEGYDYEIKQIDSIDYHIFTSSEKENIIVCETSIERYLLISSIPIDELLKMALSIE